MFVLTMTVGIALTVALLEITGLVAGGIIVPAYVSTILGSPVSLAALLVMALCVLAIVRLLEQAIPLYGTRRYGISVLLGGLLNAAAQSALAPLLVQESMAVEWTAFGFLVPGLIAYHFDRQGVLRTTLMIAVAAPLVRVAVLLLQP